MAKAAATLPVAVRILRPKALIDGSIATVKSIGNAIFLLDGTINQWNIQLARAQPLIAGRIQVGFLMDRAVIVSAQRIREAEPVVGKMVEMKSGNWRFIKLTPKDNYTKLSDLRVGRSLPSDALVKRLIDGLEEMLAQRKSLTSMLASLRNQAPGRISAIEASCIRRMVEGETLAKRVKLDWNADADAARSAVRKFNHDRYMAKKARAEKPIQSISEK
jgi:hypothetical protein